VQRDENNHDAREVWEDVTLWIHAIPHPIPEQIGREDQRTDSDPRKE
jgi:hypothetical protein